MGYKQSGKAPLFKQVLEWILGSAFFQVHTLGQPISNPIFMLGVLVFAFGELLNGYHHWLLALVRPPGVRTYGVPRGGLFGWVASPHYLGEILSVVGYAMMSDLLPVWGNALVVSAYLASRANTTLKWYQREMPLRFLGLASALAVRLLGRDKSI